MHEQTLPSWVRPGLLWQVSHDVVEILQVKQEGLHDAQYYAPASTVPALHVH